MCRSEPFRSTIVFNRSGSVAISVLSSQFSVLSSQFSLHRLAHHFFDGREAVLALAQAARPQRDHSLVYRLAPQLEARRTHEDQLAQLVRDFHHFVETDAALVAGLVA